MGLTTRLLRLPRPQSFLYTMSLRTGASLITLSLLLNKVSGLYGLLALLTGFHLNSVQLSMYVYSLLALALTASLAPHIRTQSPLHVLALVWVYVLDSVVNAAYTLAFAWAWFVVRAQYGVGKTEGVAGLGAGTRDETAGFTSPESNGSGVDEVAAPGMDAGVVGGTPSSHPAAVAAGGANAGSVLAPSSIHSLSVIIALWTIRLYFCLVMLSYARMVLRRHLALASVRNDSYTTTTASADAAGMAENPFAAAKPEGQGWKGRMGRLMVAFPRQYWLGVVVAAADGDHEAAVGGGQDVRWMEGMGGRFRKDGAAAAAGGIGNGKGNAVEAAAAAGPLERERRRRSGTGPPVPSVKLTTPGGGPGLSVPLQDLS